MDFTDFFATLREEHPPARLSPALQSLWHDAQGDWAKAHDLVNDATDADSAWVHAYLHRKEGDLVNATYWYRKADRPEPTTSVVAEWRHIVSSLLRVVDHRGARRGRGRSNEDDF
ncbi:MAG: hypothetical protein NWR72_11450 [Bacteroidia bacterium]|nr:hypothetical protein [Bacteroidia bacterium]